MLALGLVLTVVLGDSAPYVRSKTSDHCLWWPDETITFHQSVVGNPTTGSSAFSAVSTSFATWQVVMQQCGGVSFKEGDRVTTRKVGADGVNVVLFRMASCAKKVAASDACWGAGTCSNQFDCWDHASGLLGVTTVSYDTLTGELSDADIELNAFGNTFTTVNSPTCTSKVSQACVATDVQNTVTHEVGHFMGLDHTQYAGSTMNATASLGEVSKRVLDVGTKSFVCDAYPQDLPPRDCVLNPVAPELGKVAKTGCSTSAGWPALGVAALVVATLRRRRVVARGVGVAVLLVAPWAQASTVVALGMSDLVAGSDVVVQANVKRVAPRWVADHSRIVTDVELAVKQVWKGQLVGTFVVTQPGGVVGRVGQHVDGAPLFHEGDEVVLFLEARGPFFVVTGFSQGHFAVEAASPVNGGVALVRQSNASQDVVDPVTGQAVRRVPTVMPLDQLRRYVASQVAVDQVAPTVLTPR